MSSAFYVGLMSGTSLDGVDAVLADLSGERPRLAAQSHRPFEHGLREELRALDAPGHNELERAALAGNNLACLYAASVAEVLAGAGIAAAEVQAIGCHGQTVRHRPAAGYTIQIGNAALLAELTGIRVATDFRSRDIAAGGQGAPLVPAFHAAVFANPAEDRAVLNLGGIANLSFLPRSGAISGFDSGPGNCLLDDWATRHLGTSFDAGGDWAAGGRLVPELLDRMLREPYFSLAPPKSTRRDLFNEDWLRRMLKGNEDPRAVQATLLELTACSITEALRRHCPGTTRVVVCGGGARNAALLRRLEDQLRPALLETSDGHGIGPTLVEATAFAWLAKQVVAGRPASLPSVTGARGARVLGAIYPA